jgi:hypothetical protein
VHRRVRHPIDDTQDFAGRKVQIAVHLRGVVLERILEGLPVDGNFA